MGKPGRKPYRPTPQLRRTVEEMKSCGEPNLAIARAIGIDEDTLRKHFADELSFGGSKRRRQVIELLYEQARKGNVTALKKLEEMTRIAGAEAEKPAKAERLGKKDQAAEAATTAGAGTDWGDDLKPPGAAIN